MHGVRAACHWGGCLNSGVMWAADQWGLRYLMSPASTGLLELLLICMHACRHYTRIVPLQSGTGPCTLGVFVQAEMLSDMTVSLQLQPQSNVSSHCKPCPILVPSKLACEQHRGACTVEPQDELQKRGRYLRPGHEFDPGRGGCRSCHSHLVTWRFSER